MWLLILLLTILPLAVNGQFSKNRSIQTTYFPGDSVVQKMVVTKTKKLKKPQIYDFYYRINTSETEFDIDGKTILTRQRIYKMGSFGKGCGEIKYLERSFHKNGKLKQVTRNSCDCKKEVTKEFNAKGKLLYKQRRRTKRNY